ncbi:NCS1 nucleoside transporter family protein [Biscogniauxia mediterranea]|nr:NCS1 nucleoside transporter family protein [Biscogniauxia mediterranea]
MAASNWLKCLELPHAQVSRWINDDIRPIEAGRRTWHFVDFQNYWLLINCNISTYLTGSALIPLGLSWWQAMICIIIGNLIAMVATVVNSLAGAHYHIGFPVVNRMVWGMYGSYFVILNRIFLSLIWYGFQAWVGGECIYTILLSFDPKLETHVPNHMPEEIGMTTASFVAYIIFCVTSLPFVWIHPHRLQKFFYVACTITIIFFLVLLIWSLATMDGFGGTIVDAAALPSTGGPESVAWLMVYGIVSTIGSIAAGILNQNDYARFAAEPRYAIWGQAFSFPFYGILCSMIGIIVTAATQQRFGGEAVWNPPTVLQQIMALDDDGYGSRTRAAAFFGALALVVSQIGVNVPGNALSGGFDLAAVSPRWINIRRGAYIVAIFNPIVNPWRLVNTATTFLSVLSSYSVFLGPMTGLMVANYILVSRWKVNVDDLYRADTSSVYWFTYGVNWRAPIAWLVGAVPCMPGFVAAVDTSVSVPDGLTELYYLSYIYSFLAAAAAYYALHKIFPDKALDRFIQTAPPSTILRAIYQEKWDDSFEGTSSGNSSGSDRKNITNEVVVPREGV